MATFYTYRYQVPLKAGEKLGHMTGWGYYAIVAPTPAAKPIGSRNSSAAVPETAPDAGFSIPAGLPGTAPDAPSAPVAPEEITDWVSYLGLFGLDQEALNAVNGVKRTGNLSVDGPNILNSVRGTQWYRNTYPGIGEAIARGIVTNEADYRQKQNTFDQVYQQNYGRSISPGEYADFLRQGLSADIVNRQIQGDKYIEANRNSIQYAEGNFGDSGQFSEGQLKDLGRNQAGLGSPNGVNLQAQLDKAIARAQRVFQGTLASMQIAPTNQTGAPPPSNQYPDIGR